MRRDFARMIFGEGFTRLSERRQKQLSGFLAASLVAHILFLAIFGGWVLTRSEREQKTVFIAPPPIKTYEPRQLEHRVKVQKKQRSSSRPSVMPRMVSAKVSTLALPEIKMDAKVIKTSFQPKFRAVTGTGLGVGLGTGYGVGGFGTGVSAFDFFGIRGRGDKIAVLVDVSVSMVEEERGGPPGFVRVKHRINEVLDAMDEQAMFNVIAFADAASVWQREMQIASADNKTKAKMFLSPFNVEGNYGLTSGNVSSVNTGVRAEGGTTRLDLALTAAFQQGADTILVISDGLPKVRKGLTDEQRSAYQSQREAWAQANQGAVQAWDHAAAAAQWVEEKVLVPAQPGTPPGQLKEGQTPRPAVAEHWETRRVMVGGPGHPRPSPPPMPQVGYWTLTDFVQHLEALYKEFYEKKGKKPPVVHCIGYQIDNEGGTFLRKLASYYKGRYRRVARIK
ncbi:MAG: hypothetical protein BWZ02_02848 [Lentisphaerae bacterium ADurb.BinA184]|nr:MAG: hypothetical protein BWZ02_02848 [Lentisphaerae bacterium ADurb.BinA184]